MFDIQMEIHSFRKKHRGLVGSIAVSGGAFAVSIGKTSFQCVRTCDVSGWGLRFLMRCMHFRMDVHGCCRLLGKPMLVSGSRHHAGNIF